MRILQGGDTPVVRPHTLQTCNEVRFRNLVNTQRLSRCPFWFTALLLAAVSALFLAPRPAHAQEFRGTISGTVTDTTGAAIPGAKITVTATASGTTQNTVSNGVGQYVVPLLLPGNYTITAHMEGFKEIVRQGISLDASQHLIIDLKMQVGSSSQTITVSAAAPLLNTANGSVGQTITTKEVADLPLNGRTPMMLSESLHRRPRYRAALPGASL